MTPLTLPSQITLESRVTAGPRGPLLASKDYSGTVVSRFDLPDAHSDPGLPVRYVPGCLPPQGNAEPGTTAVGQSHAWVEYWAGSWTPLDPTSGTPVGERHVVVARGRDYADVPPLKGIYHGPSGGGMEV